MRTMSIDIETFSSVDLTVSGVFPYAEAPAFEILLFACSFDYEPVQVYELAAGQKLPSYVFEALTDKNILKTAYNAPFEMACLSKFFKIEIRANQWECTMARAAMCGLPLSLDMAAKALRFENGKISAGRTLIDYFSKPCKPTKANGFRERNLPKHDPEKWREFVEYNRRDVELEIQIRKAVEWYPVTPAERKIWLLDQKINNRGVRIDEAFVQNALKIQEKVQSSNAKAMVDLTGIGNPNSLNQLKKWLREETGANIESLDKSFIEKNMEALPPKVVKALKLRQGLAKTSVKKYSAMQNSACLDGRVRGLFQYYGANRTGRWAGRLVQVHNLPKNFIQDLDLARSLVKDNSSEDIEILYGNIPDILSQLVRTALIPEKGKTFIIADFSAIEARVLAWYAGETWRNEVFATHGKIYEASAAQMFKVPIDSIGKNSPLRQKGKVAELALGYQGGVGALVRMGALDKGLSEEELQELVTAWRAANPNIVRFWKEVEKAAVKAVKNKTKTRFKNLEFLYRNSNLLIKLPSERALTYVNAHMEPQGNYGREKLVYEGVNQTTRKWEEDDTYGGKLVENIIQATARDCLAEAMIRLDNAEYKIVMHIHDEVVIEGYPSDLDDCCKIMGLPVSWAQGLKLRADGFISEYYKKD